MNLIDYVITGIIVIAILCAAFSITRRKKKCKGCGKCSYKNDKPNSQVHRR